MSAKKKPSGYIATCQCGLVVGVIDLHRTDRTEAGRLLGQWVSDGCALTPRFGGEWSTTVFPCNCEAKGTAA